MAAVTIRNLAEETHRAIKARAKVNGRSAEAEVRAALDAAFRPKEKLKLGSWLHERAMEFGGVELDILREKMRERFVDFSGPEFDPPGLDPSESE